MEGSLLLFLPPKYSVNRIQSVTTEISKSHLCNGLFICIN